MEVNMHHKTNVFLLCGLVIWVAIVNCSAVDDSINIARDNSITGKWVNGACLPYARNLYTRFNQAGGEAHFIVFDWRTHNGRRGTHAIVVFLDGKGRYWGMDNLKKSPVCLGRVNSPEEWAAGFAPGYRTSVKAHSWNTAFLGQYADRKRSQERAELTSSRLIAAQ